MKRILRFGREFISIYTRANFPRASAAMSYFLTMTFFPLIICLYTMLGNSYEKAMRVMRFMDNFFSPETVRVIEEFLAYVARNHSRAMMVGGITLLVTSASAAFRSLQSTVGDMQGERRYNGLKYFGFSVAFSLLFAAAMYFGIAVTLTGRVFIDRLNSILPFIDISSSWNYLRFILLGGFEFVLLIGIYSQCAPQSGAYTVWVGALSATLASVIVTIASSYFIGASAKYPLVYGSITSLILLMLWMYLSCMTVFSGAAVNIVLSNMKNSPE